MSSKTSASFSSLSESSQLAILKKMTNAQVIGMMKYSSVVKNVVDNNSQILSSRPKFGDKLMLMATMSEIYIRHGFFKDFLKVDEEIHQRLAGISVSTLEINILDNSQIENVLEFLKTWKPVCNEIEFFGRLPASSILEMVGCTRRCTSVKMTCPDGDFSKMVPVLNKVEFSSLTRITFQSREILSQAARSLEGTDVFGQMKLFGGFELSATIPTVVKFLWDLKNATDIGNFTEASFNIPFPAEFDRFPYLFPNRRIPPTEVLASTVRGSGQGPLTIEKLGLKNGMCAIIQALDRNPRMVIKCQIMKDEEAEIKNVVNESLRAKTLRRLGSRLP